VYSYAQARVNAFNLRPGWAMVTEGVTHFFSSQ
jgi:hypothetical protein